jgi:hypothetical protein
VHASSCVVDPSLLRHNAVPQMRQAQEKWGAAVAKEARLHILEQQQVRNAEGNHPCLQCICEYSNPITRQECTAGQESCSHVGFLLRVFWHTTALDNRSSTRLNPQNCQDDLISHKICKPSHEGHFVDSTNTCSVSINKSQESDHV